MDPRRPRGARMSARFDVYAAVGGRSSGLLPSRKKHRERERSVLAEESGGLPDLVDALRWRWKPAALIPLCIFVAALPYIQKLPSEHDGKATIPISPRGGTAARADTGRVERPQLRPFPRVPQTA